MSSDASPRRTAYAALALACTLWGTSFIFGKVALRELAPAQVVLGRFVLASALLLPLAARHRLARRDWPLFLLSGALMVPCSFLLQFEGLERTSATSAALIVGALPPLLAVAAYFVDGERPGRMGWVAVATSSVGVGLLVGLPGPGRSLGGDLLVFASMLTSSAWILLTRRLLRRYSSVVVTAWSAALGMLLLLGVMALRGQAIVPAGAGALALQTWGAVAALGVLCTAATFSLWTWGLGSVSSSQAGAFVNLEPLVGAALGVALLGEAATLGTVAGGALVLGAAWVVTRQ